MDVAVIGGGASGLMAALTAAREGHRVLLLERQARVGRKLLSTGNGRCNLTNLQFGLEYYHGQQVDFARPAMEAFPPEVVLGFFHDLGLFTVAEEDGRVYPLSDQAGSVLDVLRFAVEEAGVQILTGCEVTALAAGKDGAFTLFLGEEEIHAQRVIVCCGGMAGTHLGGTSSGYALLKGLGHSATKLYPALVQIRTDNTFVKSLKGVRAQAQVRLCRGRELLRQCRGEVQFTEFGISGPVGFDLSRCAAVSPQELVLHVDLLRDMAPSQVRQALEDRQRNRPELTMENLLTGMFHNRLGRTLVRYAGYDLNSPIAQLRDSDLGRIAGAVKDFALPVTGTQGFDGAQVTAGGIRTAEFFPQTLESRVVPGLYAAGEVLDIDGDCGGYNLQWAWASGHLAGQLRTI